MMKTQPNSIVRVSTFLQNEKAFRLSPTRFGEFLEFLDELKKETGRLITVTESEDSTLYVISEMGWLMCIEVEFEDRVVSVWMK